MKIIEITQKIYIDMDGVITAIEIAAAKFNHISVQTFVNAGYPNKYWDKFKINGNPKSFFAELPWESNGKRLLSWFITYNIPFTFLTSPMAFPNTEDCITGKKIWLKNNNLNSIPVIFSFNKEKYANKNSILIDDLPINIKKWNDAGGIGLLYNNDNCNNIIKQVKKILNFNIGTGNKI